jgi:hypothetical protein
MTFGPIPFVTMVDVVSHETPDPLATITMSMVLILLVVFGPTRIVVGIVRLGMALFAPRGMAHDFSPSRQGVTHSAGTTRVGDVPHAAKILGSMKSFVKVAVGQWVRRVRQRILASQTRVVADVGSGTAWTVGALTFGPAYRRGRQNR